MLTVIICGFEKRLALLSFLNAKMHSLPILCLTILILLQLPLNDLVRNPDIDSFKEGLFVSGDNQLVILINLAVSYSFALGVFSPLAIFGIYSIANSKKKNKHEFF